MALPKDRLARLKIVWELWEEFEGNDSLMNDRREYDVRDFMTAYGLTSEQAFYLNWLIQLEHDPDFQTLYDFATRSVTPYEGVDRLLRLEAIDEVITESMHQSFDGYSDGEKVIIVGYLMDLGIAANLTYLANKGELSAGQKIHAAKVTKKKD